MLIVDLTHTFSEEMPVYPGDPVPKLEQTAFVKEHGYNEFHMDTGLHVGTHMDAPLHLFDGGERISDIPVSRFVGRGVLIDARHATKITVDLLDKLTLKNGDAVLVHTDWHKRFRNEEYYRDFPEVDSLFAQTIVDAGVSILGLDTPSPDRAPFPVHKILLGNNVLIIENLTNLDPLLAAERFELIALPAKLHCEGAPVRAIAKVVP